MRDIHISIIIPTFNSATYIKRGFFDKYIKNCKKLIRNRYRVSFIVFDNASGDNTRDLIVSKYPNIDLIYSFYNLGYAKAVNYAIQYSFHKYNSDFFIVSDHDAYPGNGCFYKIIKFMENDPKAAFVQPLVKQLPNKKKIYSAGHTYLSNGNCVTIKNYNKSLEFVEILSGSILCTGIKAKALLKTGLLDERFYIYFESNDICFRFRKAGFKNYCLLKATAYHERDLDRNTLIQKFFIKRNKLLFWYKHDKKKFKKFLDLAKREFKEFEKYFNKVDYITTQDEVNLVKYLALKESLCYLSELKHSKYKEPSLKDFAKFNQIVYNDKKVFIS
ncbi:N-acetylglucosaminyl-diphospho-decaprenol L-rhamnosyltransferase [bacterium HR35]|nr:N-acetylglucosaminyl-diphospho-decaprenol L-rhamnosyltransferase [bacterium HR35]